MKKIFKRGAADAEAAAKRSKALYDNMREAIQNKDYHEMKTIIGNPDYNTNKVGAADKRTALHTAAHEDDQESLAILLQQTSIDTNVKTTEGLTPFLLAASKGRMLSFEVLLDDHRVKPHARDGKDQTALELITNLGKEIKTSKAKELLAKQNTKQAAHEDTTKLALLIGNSEYHDDLWAWEDLQGVKMDLADMKSRLTAYGYRVEVIENSPDFLKSVADVMYKTPVASVSHLQVLYGGRSALV